MDVPLSFVPRDRLPRCGLSEEHRARLDENGTQQNNLRSDSRNGRNNNGPSDTVRRAANNLAAMTVTPIVRLSTDRPHATNYGAAASSSGGSESAESAEPIVKSGPLCPLPVPPLSSSRGVAAPRA